MNQLIAMRAFVRVVETGSFSQAANHLALPRSTVSKLVSDLESHLGIKLLNRTTRAVAATSDGLEYYPHAARLVTEVDSLDSGMQVKWYCKLYANWDLPYAAFARFAAKSLFRV